MFYEMFARETPGYEPEVIFTESDDDAGLPTWNFGVLATCHVLEVTAQFKIRRS